MEFFLFSVFSLGSAAVRCNLILSDFRMYVFIDLIIIAIGVKGVSPSPSLILKNLQTGPSKIVVGVVVVANVMLDALRARCEAIVS